MEFVIDGHNLKMLFEFNIGDKKYVAYINENDEISASRLIEHDNTTKLEKITDDKEWEEVEKEIEKRL